MTTSVRFCWSYTSGHFIWNLWNEPLVCFINFIRNDHECKILFIILPFKMNIISIRKRIVGTDVVNDVTSTHQSVTTRFLWHDVIHWITATSYDKNIEDIWLFQCKIDFYFTEWTTKAVFSRVTKPRVKIPLLVFMSEIKKQSFTEKVKFSISFLLKNCNNLVYSNASALRTETQLFP